MATDEDVVRFLGMLMAKRAALGDHPYEVLRTTPYEQPYVESITPFGPEARRIDFASRFPSRQLGASNNLFCSISGYVTAGAVVVRSPRWPL